MFPPFVLGATVELDYNATVQNPASEWGTEVGAEPILEDNTTTPNNGNTSYAETSTGNADYYCDVDDWTLPAGNVVVSVRVYVVCITLGNERINIGLRNNGTDGLTGNNSSDGTGNVSISSVAYTEYWEEWTTTVPGNYWSFDSMMLICRHNNNGAAANNRITAGRIVVTYQVPTVTTAIATNTWNNAGTWDNGIPTYIMEAVIPAGFTVTNDVTGQVGKLSVTGGTFTTAAAAGGVTLTVRELGVALSGNGTVSTKRNDGLNIRGPLSIAAGCAFNIGDGTGTANCACTDQTITCAGDITINSTNAGTVVSLGNNGIGVITCTAGTLTITDARFDVTNGSVLNNVVIGAAGELRETTLGGASYSITGNFTRTGTYTLNTGTANFTGTGAQDITGSATFYNLTVNNTAATPDDTNDVASTGAITVQTTLTVSDGQFFPATGSVFYAVSVAAAGILKSAAAGDAMSISSSMVQSGTFTHNNGTVTFNGSTAQTIAGSMTFYNLTINNTYATPDDTNDVEFTSAVTVTNTVNVNDGQFSMLTGSSFNNVIIGAAGFWKTVAGGATITVSGDWTFSGSYTPNGCVVNFNGSGSQIITGVITFYSISVNNTAASPDDTNDVEAVSAITIARALVVTDGQFMCATGTAINNATISAATGIFKPAAGASVSVYGTWSNDGVFTANSSTITMDGVGAQTMIGSSATTFYNLTINNTYGTPDDTNDVESTIAVNVTNTLDVTDGQFSPFTGSTFKDVSIAAAGIFDPPAATGAYSVSGDFSNSGTFTHNTSLFTFNGSVAQTITGATTFYRLTINNTHASPDDSNDVESTAALVVTGILTVTDGQFTPFTGSTFGSVSIGAAGILKPVSTISVNSGDWTNNGTFTHNNGTVTFNSTLAQAINGATTFYNLTCNKAAQALTCQSTISITVTNLCSVTNNTFWPSDGSQFNNVSIAIGGTFRPIVGATIYVSGNMSRAGTFTHNNSTMVFNGTGAQAITVVATITFYNLRVENSAAVPGDAADVEATGRCDVSNNLAVVDGQYTSRTNSVITNVGITTNGIYKLNTSATNSVTGTWTNNGTFTANSGTISFTGTTAQTIAGATTFYNLTINNGHVAPSDVNDVESSAALTVTNTLSVSDGQFSPFTGSSFKDVTIAAAGIMKPAASGSTISVSGNWTRSGTFTHNDGTVSFNTTTTATISASTDWYNFSCTTGGKQINFTAGTTQNIAGTLTLTGSLGSLITLRSTSAGVGWDFANPAVTTVAYYVDVQDSNAANDIYAVGSTNSGNNDANWIFMVAGDWVGIASTDWNNGANWGDGQVPNGIAARVKTVVPGAGDAVISAAVADVTTITVFAGKTLTIDSGGSVQVSGDVSVFGTLVINDNAMLAVTGNIDITLQLSAELRIRGDDPSAAATAGTITSDLIGTDKWTLLVSDSSIIDIRGARLIDGYINPFGAQPAEFKFADVLFYSLPAGVGNAFINLESLDSGAMAFNKMTFNRGSAVSAANASNIRADAGTRELWIGGYAGDLGGETFDNDPSGRIHWVNNAVKIKVDNGAVTYAESLDEALDGLGAGTLKIYANYIDASGDLVSAFQTVPTPLVLPNFTGTLELDGFVFRTTASSATLIDTSAVVGGGVVKLYNCMLLDPEDSGATGRALVTGGGTVTADFCTVDTDTMATSGLDSEDDCLFTRPIVSANYVNSGDRNFHLTLTGNAAIGAGDGALVAGHERDIDGMLRPDATSVNLGADYYGSSGTAASILNPIDVTGGLAATADMVVVEGGSVLGADRKST
ncbi:MAG: hypothetical protein HUU29_07990, partial [Planctomycetaceae bacterium]|nr:hypothetical protein [Planctomycetaceae bacterium]